MNLLFINPNTTAAFTDRVRQIATQYADPGTSVLAVNPASGPRSIESIYDELLSAAPTLQTAIENLETSDAFVIACYSDHPTVYALRELTSKPVLGVMASLKSEA